MDVKKLPQKPWMFKTPEDLDEIPNGDLMMALKRRSSEFVMASKVSPTKDGLNGVSTLW